MVLDKNKHAGCWEFPIHGRHVGCSGAISSTQHSGVQFELGMEILSESEVSEGEGIQNEARATPECDRGSSTSTRSTPSLVLYKDSQDIFIQEPDKSSKTVPNERFKAPLAPADQKKLTGKTFADSTDQKITWAVSLYRDWRHLRIESGELSDIFQIINSDIEEPGLDKVNLRTALRAFLSDVKHADGGEYPGKTLYSLLIMIQLHLDKTGLSWKLLDDKEFLCVRNTLDNLMKE